MTDLTLDPPPISPPAPSAIYGYERNPHSCDFPKNPEGLSIIPSINPYDFDFGIEGNNPPEGDVFLDWQTFEVYNKKRKLIISHETFAARSVVTRAHKYRRNFSYFYYFSFKDKD